MLKLVYDDDWGKPVSINWEYHIEITSGYLLSSSPEWIWLQSLGARDSNWAYILGTFKPDEPKKLFVFQKSRTFC